MNQYQFETNRNPSEISLGKGPGERRIPTRMSALKCTYRTRLEAPPVGTATECNPDHQLGKAFSIKIQVRGPVSIGIREFLLPILLRQ
jgi:hypothetical protein